MSFKGNPHDVGAGRKKGTPNKFTKSLQDKCDELGVDPFMVLLKFTQHDDPQIAMQAAKEVCQYILPKRKAIEVSGENPFADRPLEELKEMVKERLKSEET